MAKIAPEFRAALKAERDIRAREGRVLASSPDLRFEKQQALWADTAKRKIAFCGRRAGKTLGWCLDAYESMAAHPGDMVLYIGITRNAAKDIIWRAFKTLSDRYRWGLTFRESDLRAFHANGSSFVVMGADKLPELEKARGPEKIRLAIVDECQSTKPFNLRYLVEDVLEPGLMDVNGTLCLSGTPGRVPFGFWHDATTGVKPGWSIHTWTAYDNPHVQAATYLAELCRRRGVTMEDPSIRREYLCQWVTDKTNLAIPWDTELNEISVLPATDDKWTYVLSMDFGVVHSTAWSVLGYGPYGKEVYVFRSFKKPGMTPTDVGEITHKLIAEWDPSIIVGDLGGLGKAYAVEMEQQHGISIKMAQKKDKRGAIEFLADAVRTGLVKSHKDNRTLHQELSSIVWDDYHEDLADGQDDHEMVALLYGFRECPAYANVATPKQRQIDGLPTHVRRSDESADEYHIAWVARRRKRDGTGWVEEEDWL